MTPAEQNKKLLLDLYDAVVGAKWDAVRTMLTDDFIDHNPGVPHDPAKVSGREAFIAYFRKGDTPLDGGKVEIKRIIADDAHVMVHYKLTNATYPNGIAWSISSRRSAENSRSTGTCCNLSHQLRPIRTRCSDRSIQKGAPTRSAFSPGHIPRRLQH